MNLLKRKGFYQTLRLLDNIDGEISLKNFFAKFNETSYYNAFFRVKQPLLNAKIIKIKRRRKGGRTIMLTEKGRRVWAMVLMISDLTNEVGATI